MHRLSDIKGLEPGYKPKCPECNRELRPADVISTHEARALQRGKRPRYVAHLEKCPERTPMELRGK